MQATLDGIRRERLRLGLTMTEIILPRLAKELVQLRQAQELTPGDIAARAGKDKAKWGSRVAAFERTTRGIDYPTLCAILPAYGMAAEEVRRLVAADHADCVARREAKQARERATSRWQLLGRELLLAAIPQLLDNADEILQTPRYAHCPAPGDCAMISSAYCWGGIMSIGQLVGGWRAVDDPGNVPAVRCHVCGARAYFFSGMAGLSFGNAHYFCRCGRETTQWVGGGLLGKQERFRKCCPSYPGAQAVDFLTLLDGLGIAYDAAKAAEYRALGSRAEPTPTEMFGGFQVRGRGPLVKIN